MYYSNQFYRCPMLEQDTEQVTDLIIEAMKDERNDRAKYKMMMEMTDDDKVKEQIRFAYEDEGKHYKLFQALYHQLTTQYVEIPYPDPMHYDDFIEAVESSINGELKAVELYRKIRSMLPSEKMRDALYEIITDEQEHATRFVYIYSMKK